MCLNCGCGEPETRHKDTDITADDVRQAAGGSSIGDTISNIQKSLSQMQPDAGTAAAGSMSGMGAEPAN